MKENLLADGERQVTNLVHFATLLASEWMTLIMPGPPIEQA
jgi:hypothetical protein